MGDAPYIHYGSEEERKRGFGWGRRGGGGALMSTHRDSRPHETNALH